MFKIVLLEFVHNTANSVQLPHSWSVPLSVSNSKVFSSELCYKKRTDLDLQTRMTYILMYMCLQFL